VRRPFQRLLSRTIERFAGDGVGVDEAGRLTLPDGLTAERAHRFIDLCTGCRHPSPKAAIHDLFRRIGVPPATIASFEEVLGDRGDLDLRAAARHAFALSAALPRLLEIPGRIRRFLVEDLGLADAASETLEEAVVSTRREAASRLGCEADWDAILAHPDGVAELTRSWRRTAADPPS
jgi:hypothetical protein